MTRTTRTIIATLFVMEVALPMGFASDAASTPPLPLGCWTLNANGTQGQLCIPSLNADGSFVGSMVFTGYTNTAVGLWSSGPQQLTFLRLGIATNPLSYQSFTGFLFPTDSSNPSGAQTLAGSFSVYGPAGGSMQTRNFYGWTATHP